MCADKVKAPPVALKEQEPEPPVRAARAPIVSPPERAPSVASQAAGNQAMQHLLRKVAIQAKMKVSQPGDKYEWEADQMADQVLAAPADPLGRGEPARIQRCVEQPTTRLDGAPDSVDRILTSPGRPLDLKLQQDMEQRFGHDFSRVRVHSDAAAEQSAQDVNANAYTAGHNIVFGAGQFAPGTNEGRRLIAHELTHTIQQGTTETHDQTAQRASLSKVDGGMIQRVPDDSSAAPSLDQQYKAAIQAARQTGNWQDAAEKLNGFNYEDIQSRLAQLTEEEVAYLHLGALDNPRVGPDSQVSQLTKPGTPRASTAPPTATSASRISATAPVNTSSRSVGGKPISEMTETEKLVEAYDRADIGKAFREKLFSLITPKALVFAIISFAVVFIASQFTPIGWAADIGLALTAAFVGTALFTAIEHLIKFADGRHATTSEQLDQAGAEFAEAAAEIGVDAIILLVTHGLGGPKGGVPYKGPPPTGFVFAITEEGALVPVVANTISAEVVAQLGIKGAIATEPLMSRGSGSGGSTRDFEPPVRDHAGKAGGELPRSGPERQRAIESWTKEELQFAAAELKESIAARKAEQLRLGETSVGPAGQRTGAAHRVRIDDEESLLKAILKKLSGT
jgi:hypothetical protein